MEEEPGAPLLMPDKETSAVRWATYEEAKTLIGMTTNPKGRVRDLNVLEAAYAEWRRVNKDWAAGDESQPTVSDQRWNCPEYNFVVMRIHRIGFVLLIVLGLVLAATSGESKNELPKMNKDKRAALEQRMNEYIEAQSKGDLESAYEHSLEYVSQKTHKSAKQAWMEQQRHASTRPLSFQIAEGRRVAEKGHSETWELVGCSQYRYARQGKLLTSTSTALLLATFSGGQWYFSKFAEVLDKQGPVPCLQKSK
jgi:hypothetical protein